VEGLFATDGGSGWKFAADQAGWWRVKRSIQKKSDYCVGRLAGLGTSAAMTYDFSRTPTSTGLSLRPWRQRLWLEARRRGRRVAPRHLSKAFELASAPAHQLLCGPLSWLHQPSPARLGVGEWSSERMFQARQNTAQPHRCGPSIADAPRKIDVDMLLCLCGACRLRHASWPGRNAMAYVSRQ
jgi:hypothetical protein